MKLSVAILLILSASLIFLPAQNVLAHAMLIEQVEKNVVRVVFDDGTANRHAEVVVFSESGEELGRGNVERDGTFKFPLEEGMLVVAEDGFGHRAEYVAGTEVPTGLPRLPVVSLVLFGFIAIAGVFHYRVKKKNQA